MEDKTFWALLSAGSDKSSDHSWIIWDFFYSLSPCVSGCRKIREALSIFGIEMGVRGPSPVLVSYNISQGQAPRNAGSLLKFIQTPAQSATNLLKNKFSVKMLICFLCLKKASHEKHLGSIFKSICKYIYSDDKKDRLNCLISLM